MAAFPRYLAIFLVAASPALAQAPATADTTTAHDEAPHGPPFEFGVAGGALSYEGGRQEQAIGAVLRWVTTPWLSLSATPTAVRVREPSATVVSGFQSTTGVVDLPLD